ncbi:hypothetical protein VTK26DRAFT_7738 [Humicola hyalothermophila]
MLFHHRHIRETAQNNFSWHLRGFGLAANPWPPTVPSAPGRCSRKSCLRMSAYNQDQTATCGRPLFRPAPSPRPVSNSSGKALTVASFECPADEIRSRTYDKNLTRFNILQMVRSFCEWELKNLRSWSPSLPPFSFDTQVTACFFSSASPRNIATDSSGGCVMECNVRRFGAGSPDGESNGAVFFFFFFFFTPFSLSFSSYFPFFLSLQVRESLDLGKSASLSHFAPSILSRSG